MVGDARARCSRPLPLRERICVCGSGSLVWFFFIILAQYLLVATILARVDFHHWAISAALPRKRTALPRAGSLTGRLSHTPAVLLDVIYRFGHVHYHSLYLEHSTPAARVI